MSSALRLSSSLLRATPVRSAAFNGVRCYSSAKSLSLVTSPSKLPRPGPNPIAILERNLRKLITGEEYVAIFIFLYGTLAYRCAVEQIKKLRKDHGSKVIGGQSTPHFGLVQEIGAEQWLATASILHSLTYSQRLH